MLDLFYNMSGFSIIFSIIFSSGNIRPQSSQLTELLWTNPGIKSGISVSELMPTLKKKHTKKKKKRRRGMSGDIFSQNPRERGKSHHHFVTRVPLVPEKETGESVHTKTKTRRHNAVSTATSSSSTLATGTDNRWGRRKDQKSMREEDRP